jgi:Ser/Thr protein kinase RdoA (MazF antagonist)
VLHGDLNCSNFFYERKENVLYVFDTDQVQRGFYLWDLSQAVFTSYMLEHAGMPISGTPVPEANSKEFQSWIVEGYESVAGKGWVDLKRL